MKPREVTKVHKLRVVLDVSTFPRGNGYGACIIDSYVLNWLTHKTRRAALADLKRRLEGDTSPAVKPMKYGGCPSPKDCPRCRELKRKAVRR